MKFDFENFFRGLGVETRTSGKNVKRGWINVNCPLCGDDRGFHLGCNPESGFWGCWRSKTHRGSLARLVRLFKGCSWEEAKRIAGEDQAAPPESIDALEQQVEALGKRDRDYFARVVKFPTEFLEVRPGSRLMRPFADYIASRKFPDPFKVARHYEMRGCTYGDWRGRLILPFFHTRAQMIGWQGRAISRHATLRYVSHPGGAVTKKFVFNRGYAAKGGKILVVVEGPIDCYKVDYYGRKHGIHAVATLGTSFVDAQVAQIDRLAERYDHTLILYDPEALTDAMDLQSRLIRHRPDLGFLPPGVEDPGDLAPDQVADAVFDCV